MFGLPPPRLDESDKKTKKRKQTPDEGDESSSSSKVASSSKAKLEAFRSTQKPASAATGGLGAEAARELPREGEEMEETQLVDETQESMPLARTDSELQSVREEAEEDDDTQMSETQVETQPGAQDFSVSLSLSLSPRVKVAARSSCFVGSLAAREGERTTVRRRPDCFETRAVRLQEGTRGRRSVRRNGD